MARTTPRDFAQRPNMRSAIGLLPSLVPYVSYTAQRGDNTLSPKKDNCEIIMCITGRGGAGPSTSRYKATIPKSTRREVHGLSVGGAVNIP